MVKLRIDLRPTEAEAQLAESQIKEKQQEIKYNIRDFTVDYLVTQFTSDLFFVPDYQRLFVWSEENRCKFIESVLLGFPIPMLFVADLDDGRLEIVDGAQRIQTLESFLNNDLTLTGLEILDKLNGFKFADLPVPQQRKIGTKAMRVVVMEDVTSLAIRQELFNRINRQGMRAKGVEIRRGAFAGPFMDFIRDCSQDPLFLALCPISAQMLDRRENEELITRFFAYSDQYQGFRHDVDKFLDRFVAEHRNIFDRQRMQDEFIRTMTFVHNYFPNGFAKGPRAKTTPRVRFEAIAVGTNLALRENRNLIPQVPPAEWINSEEFEAETTTHASNSLPRLKRRIEFVRKKLLGK